VTSGLSVGGRFSQPALRSGDDHPPMRKPVKWIIGAVVAVVVLVVAVPFIYINFIEGDPPKAFSVDQGPTTSDPSATPLTSIDGTWSITDRSQAGYRIKETLFGQSTEAVGRTTKVTGQLTASGTTISTASFSVDLTSVSSDQSQRDSQFQGRIMNTSKFPTATFALTSPIDIGSIPAEGQTIDVKATGDLTLHGVTKSVTFDLTAKVSGQNINVAGSTDIVFADYGIDNPSAGPAQTGDDGILEVQLFLAKA
jgi:polyisoprenoid-binding protein YceI